MGTHLPFSRGCGGVGLLISGHILLQLWLVRIYILISFESLVNIVLILLQDLSLSYLARVRLRLLRQQQEKERGFFSRLLILWWDKII